ncbi:MAG TPA: phosphogluconate dehydrogenase (NAD(+)-dependent, decarboxylating) [Candidatus Tripitaka californicus]|uniref:phosphogluconate dehydrogenase (NAD(+)-dependent, decarboxylating) n=1 Tax=Candidatus Tripitaka californicus TaxID=3367616 RepID=UPI004028BF4C
MEIKKEFGIIGLGRMGGNLASRALKKGMRVVGFCRKGASKVLIDAGIAEVRRIQDFSTTLNPPRAIFIYIPAGPAVDSTLGELSLYLQPEDVIVDGGNSYWGDSIRRYQKLIGKGIHFVDVGTSGGVEGAIHGACFMAGGDSEGIARVEPILKELAIENGHIYAGPPGTGHFTKLVHNGIEFGMLQAIGEGIALLERYPHHKLNILEILRCWRNGSVIRSWLVELMEAAYETEVELKNIPPYVEDTGEVNWLVEDAIRMEIPIPVIAQSIMQLFVSRDDKKDWARAIAVMRHQFGGHPYGPSDVIKKERKEGRVGGFYEGSGSISTETGPRTSAGS